LTAVPVHFQGYNTGYRLPGTRHKIQGNGTNKIKVICKENRNRSG